jgi:uncharacterized protein (DUF305 family)
MNRRNSDRLRAVQLCVLALLSTGCGTATARPAVTPDRPPVVRPLPFSAADVEFMTSMIPHHAQAVVMAGLAETRSTRQDLRVLAQRIIVAQRDEIALMRMWLEDRGQSVPAADATHHRHRMNGVEHEVLMPGMLTEQELAQLEAARGAEFDRLFLTFMIRHHEGALTMVEQLFNSYGAAQDEVVFRFASDVFADQSTEIERMESILATILADG